MTMTSTTNLRRSSGKLVLLAALFVSLLHAATAAVKLVSEIVVADERRQNDSTPMRLWINRIGGTNAL
jgi:hypothetical protein